MTYGGTPDSERLIPSEKIYQKEIMHETLKSHFGTSNYRELKIGEKFKKNDACYHQNNKEITVCRDDSLQVEEGYVYYFMHKPFFRREK